jgi:hypothetical protein
LNSVNMFSIGVFFMLKMISSMSYVYLKYPMIWYSVRRWCNWLCLGYYKYASATIVDVGAPIASPMFLFIKLIISLEIVLF